MLRLLARLLTHLESFLVDCRLRYYAAIITNFSDKSEKKKKENRKFERKTIFASFIWDVDQNPYANP